MISLKLNQFFLLSLFVFSILVIDITYVTETYALGTSKFERLVNNISKGIEQKINKVVDEAVFSEESLQLAIENALITLPKPLELKEKSIYEFSIRFTKEQRALVKDHFLGRSLSLSFDEKDEKNKENKGLKKSEKEIIENVTKKILLTQISLQSLESDSLSLLRQSIKKNWLGIADEVEFNIQKFESIENKKLAHIIYNNLNDVEKEKIKKDELTLYSDLNTFIFEDINEHLLVEIPDDLWDTNDNLEFIIKCTYSKEKE